MANSTRSAPSVTRRLRCDHVVLPDADGGLSVGPAIIDLDGALIAGVYTDGSAPELPAGIPVDTLRESLLSPAFIDAHTHLALTCLRGLGAPEAADHNLVEAFFYSVEAHMTAEDVRAFVRVGALEALLSGTGLVWDHYYFPHAVADGLRDIGLAGVVAPTLQDRGGPGAHALEDNLDATVALAGSSTSRDDGIYAALGLHATDTVSRELLNRCAPIAQTHALPVHCHVAQSLDELERVATTDGCGSGEHLLRSELLDAAPHSLLVHGILLTDLELAALSDKRVTLAFCPHSKQIFAYLPDVPRWMEHGLDWLVGTDCAASNDGWSVPRELRFVAGMRSLATTWSTAHQSYLAHGGVVRARAAWAAREDARRRTQPFADDSFVLSRGWQVPGGIHPGFVAGTIAPGARAQFAVWDRRHPCFWPGANPLRALVWGRTTGALKRMMVNGRWWSESDDLGRAVVDSDLWKQSRAEADARLSALLDRAG